MNGCLHMALLYDIWHKCQLNLSTREQPLLPALDVFGLGLGHKAPFSRRARKQKCCRRRTTQHTPAEHRGAYCKQDLCHWAASLYENGFHHRPKGDPLRNCRQASNSQVLTSWVSPEQKHFPRLFTSSGITRGGKGKYLPPGVARWGRRIEVRMFRTNLHYDANNC